MIGDDVGFAFGVVAGLTDRRVLRHLRLDLLLTETSGCGRGAHRRRRACRRTVAPLVY
jgi:hypothetical protein